jgi:hypothetical protein
MVPRGCQRLWHVHILSNSLLLPLEIKDYALDLVDCSYGAIYEMA